MTSQDDLALLKQMYQRGEISDEQYDVLRRHVLWGTPLPQLMDEVPGPRRETPPAAVAPPAPRADPDVPAFAADRYASGEPDRYGAPPGSRRARREAAEAAELDRGHPSAYPPPTGSTPPPAGPARRDRSTPPASAAGSPPATPARPPYGYGPLASGPPADGYGPPPSGPPVEAYGALPGTSTDHEPRPGRSSRRAHGYDPLPGTSPRPVGPATDDKAPPGSPARPAEGYGPPPGTSRRPIGPATEYDPPPGGSLPPAVRSDGYGSLGEPRSRRARREAAERAARPTESYRPISPGDYSPSAYLPPEGLPGPAGLPGTASPAAHSNSPDDTGHTDQLRPPADGASRLHPAVHRVDRPPADGAGGVRPPRRSRSGSRSAVDAGQRPAGEPGELPASPPDELQPRRARREAGTARPDDPRRSQKRERPRTGATRVTDQLSRARRRRSVVAVLTSVVLALALAAGGVWWFTLRQAGVPPDDYATSICGSVRDWQQSVDSSNSTLITTIAREQNRTAVRSAVSAYYTSIAGRTDQLRASILDAGVADVPGGRAYADSLAAAVGTEATDLRGLAARAGRLDPAAAATFQIELQSLLTGSETTVGTVSSALARPSAGTPTVLRAALSAEPSCAPYVG